MSVSHEPVAYALPFFGVTLALEFYLGWKWRGKIYDVPEAAASIGMGIGSMIINLGMKAVAFTGYTFLHQFRLFDIGWHWWSWLLLVPLDDFSFYWHHRFSHHVRFLWAGHVNHHSALHLNLATALRQGWGEQVYKYVWWAWLPLLGFPPLMVLMMISFSLLYQYCLHTELIGKLPRGIEFIFNTPSHHRVHHASNVRYLDTNLGGVFIIWDRLFGTFAGERDDDRPIYGLTHNIHTIRLLLIAGHEFVAMGRDVRRAPKFTDRLRYIFGAPGWSHDGPDLRARTMRKLLAEGKISADFHAETK
ncbi:MAG: sterol desaturase family protein [Verrucomicrobia bacterium]|nr:sterol desaturase family protein [Verrucomicrobiota bacterium]